MSTATRRPTTLDISDDARAPFTRLVKVELRKTYDTRAGIWLLGITAFLAAAVMVIALIVVLVQDEPITLDDFVGIANFSSGFLLPVLGIMLVTSEWSQRTAMVTFTLESHRGRIVTAKLVAGLHPGPGRQPDRHRSRPSSSTASTPWPTATATGTSACSSSSGSCSRR